jgi:hypothetical protein
MPCHASEYETRQESALFPINFPNPQYYIMQLSFGAGLSKSLIDEMSEFSIEFSLPPCSFKYVCQP